MRLKSILLFLSIFAGIFRSSSQSNHTINFDTSGRIRSVLPERIYKDDKLYFQMNAPGETFEQYTKQLKKKVQKAVEHLDSIRTHQSDKALLKVIYDIGDSDLHALDSVLKKVLINQSTNAVIKYIPVFKPGDENYYKLQPIHTVNSAEISFGPNLLSSELNCKLLPGEKELDFKLTKIDPFKKLRYDWLTATASDYNALPDLSAISALLPELHQKVITVNEFLKKNDLTQAITISEKAKINNVSFFPNQSNFIIKVLNTLDSVTIPLTRYLNVIRPSLHIADKNWILNWFWYQDNQIPLLNPFPFRTEETFGREPDTTELEGLRRKIALREQFYKTANVDKMNVRVVDSLIDVSDSLRKRQDSILKTAKSYGDKVSKNDKNQLAFGTTGSLLNTGAFFVGNDDSLFWMRHHDATENFLLMNDLDSREYSEDDRVIILAHNLKVGQRVDLHLGFQDIINDESQLSTIIRGILEGLTPSAKKIATVAARSFDNDSVASRLDSATLILIDSLGKKVTRMQNALELAKTYTRAINYLVAQTDPVINVKEVTDKSVAYHSEVANPVRKVDGPKKATYYMNTVSSQPAANNGNAAAPVVADTFHYRINKLYRIFPMAGITYRTTKFNKVTRDVGSTVDKNVREPAIQFIVGAKVYIRKTDIHDPKGFWSKDRSGRKLWPSRTSINIAVEAKDPLANVFTGIGLDIWPGFCINVGAAFNRYRYNVYTNGELSRSDNLYRTGIYVGLSTDINLFTDLARFLNLTK